MNTYCSSCHINPSGGGPRNDQGKSYGEHLNEVQKLEYETISEPQKKGDLQMDFLFMGLSEENEDATFFPMQASLYGVVHPRKKTTLVLNLNKTGRTSDYSVEEAYALLNVLPRGGYIKIGKFDTAYGLNLAEHIAFVRRSLGFDFDSQDSGIEAGFVTKDHHYVHLAFTNGSFKTTPATDLFDVNQQKAVLLKIGGWGKLSHGFGGFSFYNSKNAAFRMMRYGPYGSFKLGKLMFLGEFDFGKDKLSAGGTETSLLAAYGELSFRQSRHVHWTGTLEVFDPNGNVKNDDLFRMSLTHRLLLNQNSSLNTTYQKNFETPEVANDKFFMIYHLWF